LLSASGTGSGRGRGRGRGSGEANNETKYIAPLLLFTTYFSNFTNIIMLLFHPKCKCFRKGNRKKLNRSNF
jgi:hypothetical protein